MFSLGERVALVTGAGGGIGRVFAGALAEAGASVAVHDRSADYYQEAQRYLEDRGIRASYFEADLARVEECQGLIGEVTERLGRIDVLVNCAAANRRGAIAEMDEASFDFVMAVNVRAPYFLSQAVRPIMARQGGGKIINIGSINQFYGLATVSVYGLSKGALGQFTKAAAVEWAPDNIQVNCLTPGFIVTPMNEEALWGVGQTRHWILDRVPASRPGMPTDLAGALLFLASSASDFVTGQSFVVDGGFLAGGSWAYQGALPVGGRA